MRGAGSSTGCSFPTRRRAAGSGPDWPADAEDVSIEGRPHVVRLLRRALRAEGQRSQPMQPTIARASPRQFAQGLPSQGERFAQGAARRFDLL